MQTYSFNFNLHPTPTAQWYALIEEVLLRKKLTLEDSLANYLVLTLDHFVRDEEFASIIIAIDFLKALENFGFQGNTQLRTVGDRCLLLAGLFPERAQRRRLPLTYVIGIGQSAYQTLADIPVQFVAEHELFHKLSENFVYLTQVLQAIRTLSHERLE